MDQVNDSQYKYELLFNIDDTYTLSNAQELKKSALKSLTFIHSNNLSL
jgi:hypothetical protein